MTYPPFLERAVAQEVVAPVQPDYPVTEVVRRTGGEVSAVYEIRGAGGVPPLIVKVYAPQWRPKLVKEVYVYRLLARHGVRHIPRVRHAAPFGTSALPWAHTVMSWMPGRPLAEVRLTREESEVAYRRMGELLAAVHRIAQEHWGYVTTRVVDVRASNSAYMADQFARRLHDFGHLGGDPRLARTIARHVSRHADRFAACTAPVLCHNDFHQGNVLVSPTGQVTGFVDVEGAIAADPLFDLARTDYFLFGAAVRSSLAGARCDAPDSRTYALRDDPARRSAFLDGYGPLPVDTAERVDLYQLHHALELWNWAASTGRSTDQSRALADIRLTVG